MPLIERDAVVVLDVRDIDGYKTLHIAGAKHIPLSYIESELPYLERSKPIVAYCT
jgi:rhodanese-related sulfurtransferase